MEKVKVSKEVAECLENALKNHDEEFLVRRKAKGTVFSEETDALNTLDLDTLIRALYIGYEIESTPEDKVRELYEHFKQPSSGFAGYDVCNKISLMFDALNIKIKGVNDHG